jgi:hypothetical protein
MGIQYRTRRLHGLILVLRNSKDTFQFCIHGHADYTTVKATVCCQAGASVAAYALIKDPSPLESRPRIDLRATRRLPPDAPHLRTKRVIPCLPGACITIRDVHSSELSVIEDPFQLYALWREFLLLEESAESGSSSWRDGSSSHGPHRCFPAPTVRAFSAWNEFSFLPTWTFLSAEEKRQKVCEMACYELFFFVKLVDPPFFVSEIKPLLALRMASERDVMVWLLLDDLDALRAAQRDMRCICGMSPLETLLVAGTTGNWAAVKSIAAQWSLVSSDREMEAWCVNRVALQMIA